MKRISFFVIFLQHFLFRQQQAFTSFNMAGLLGRPSLKNGGQSIVIVLAVLLFTYSSYGQRVGIGTTAPSADLEVKHAGISTVKISSNSYNDTTQLIFSNRDGANQGTDINFTSIDERGLRVSSSSDIPKNQKDTIMQITPQGNIGIRTASPAFPLDVNGNMNVSGELKVNGVSGTAGQVLQSNGNNTMKWATIAGTSGTGSTNGSVGFGSWGDCSTNNITDYQPMVDTIESAAELGYSVSISGNYAIAGSPYQKNGSNLYQGSASIWQLNGTAWQLMTKLVDATGTASCFFGFNVAISGNYAIVGAPFETVGGKATQGTASIYQLVNGAWVLMSKITDATGIAGENFGKAVSISGSYAIVGAPGDRGNGQDGSGSASIYHLTGSSWTFVTKLATDVIWSGVAFGTSVSISGNYAIVGSPGEAVGFSSSGTAFIYKLSGSSWVFMNKISTSNSGSGVGFGSSVSISGNYAIVGTPGEDIISTIPNQGSATIFHLTGGSWVQSSFLYDKLNGKAEDNFGINVSISGDYAMIGTAGEVAHIYQRVGAGWQRLQRFTDPGSDNNNKFGNTVGIDGVNKRFLVGAPAYGVNNGKVAFGRLNL